MFITYSKQIPIESEVDILVIGGSQSGVAAAISARRTNPNLKVLLIEQYGYLGGQSVGTMVSHYEFREYTNNAGQIIAKGIGREIIARVIAKGHSDPLYKEWLDGQGPPFRNVFDPRAMGDIPLDIEDLKITLQEICNEAGVEVRLFTKLIDMHTLKVPGNNPRPDIAILSSFGQTFGIRAKIMIDCSANNDITAMIDPEQTIVPQQKVMPMQAYIWLGGIDCEKFIRNFWEHREGWTLVYPNNKEQMLNHMYQGKTMMMKGGAAYLDIADEKYPGILQKISEYCCPYLFFWLKPMKINPIKCGDHVFYDSIWAIEGPWSFVDQTNPKAISQFQQNQLIIADLLVKIHSVLPGWENCCIARTSDRMGFRQTRILKGIYALKESDIKGNARFADVIGRAAGHDISRDKPQYEFGYDIPYRALIPERIDGLLVGARSISCDPDDPRLVALNAQRGISATIIVSQATGIAAALCVQGQLDPRDLSIDLLQKELRKQNVILEPPK